MRIIGFLNKENSILRRSFLALILNFPVAVIALSLNFLASKITDQFGIFYISLSSINIIFSGSLILNLIITEICIKKDGYFDKNQYLNILGYFFTFSFAVFILFIPVSFILSKVLSFSFILIIVIIFSSLVSYFAEIGRVFLQCKDNFFYAGIYNLVWVFIRNLTTLTILAFTNQIWLAILFFGLSSILPILFILKFYFKNNNNFNLKYLFKFNQLDNFSFNKFYFKHKKKIKLFFSFIAYSILCFSDLILSYLLFDENLLNVISSSLIIPKGIIVFSIPLVHIFFVTLIKNNKNNYQSFSKAILSVFISTLFIVIFFKYTQFYYCGTSKGIELCNNKFLNFAMFNSILFVIFRTQILDLNNLNRLFSISFWLIFGLCYFLYSILTIINVEEIFLIQKYFVIFLLLLSLIKKFSSSKIILNI